MKQFNLSILETEEGKVINFANNTRDFVEVIFTIDGEEVREGKALSLKTKGYAYTPKLEKPVKRMRTGMPLQFSNKGGEVVAYIYSGEGEYKSEDMDKPAFLRNKLVDKIKFKRTSDKPIQILKIKY